MILGAICLSIILFQWIYYHTFIGIVLQYEDPVYESIPQDLKLKIVVAVKDNSEGIERLLHALEAQELPPGAVKPAILIVDDYSQPNHFAKMQELINAFSLHITLLSNPLAPGKKNAMLHAYSTINHNEWIITTDSDCLPASNHWLKRMILSLETNKIILGHAPFIPQKSLINALSRFETTWITGQFWGYTLQKTPYMGLGRNMGIHAAILPKTMSRMKGKELLSGDDDLLIQAADPQNIGILTHPESFMLSASEQSYGAYLRQKRRQISTSFHYKWQHKILLGVIGMTQILVYPLILVLFFYQASIALFLLLLKYGITQYYFGKLTARLGEFDLRNKIIFLELIYGIHLMILALYTFVSRNIVWK